MTPPEPVAVSPRRDGDPEPDLTAYRLVHRAMVRDVRDLATVAADLAAGRETLTPWRASALSAYAGKLCREITLHHRAEDQLVWPVVAASAGPAVDVSAAVDDHGALEPLVTRTWLAARALGRDPGDRGVVTRLAESARELHALLDEHVTEEETEVFPALTRYVSVADYDALERRLARDRTLARDAWVVPWLAWHAGPADRRRLRATVRPRDRLLLAVTWPGFRRTRRRALG
jgi:Hemerythrin HHE cation binding domain